MAQWLQMTLQESMSVSHEMLNSLHSYIMLYLVLILAGVGYILVAGLCSSFTHRTLTENQTAEFLWTSLPAIILLLIAFPSLHCLYTLDESINSDVTVKVIGHQWYWSYEYGDISWLNYDSYMIPTESLEWGNFRLLEVDNRLIVPLHSNIRLLITAADVIHSWTVPSLGVKADAIPGRLNQINFNSSSPGLFYGQCSEICGSNHSFMPICVECVPFENFEIWGFGSKS